MAFGTGIALLPERSYAFALAKMPSEAAATTAAVLLAVGIGFLSPTPAFAQHVEQSQIAPIVPRSEAEQNLHRRIVCLCGACGKEQIGTCTCSVAADMRREIATLLDQGKTEDEVVQHFIGVYGGQQFLGAPLDEGFNRLAWLFPYLVGAGGAVLAGRRPSWSRKRARRRAATR
jgi:cytochrome c-type biogenesis protein CcmH/NrfF